MEYGLPQNAVEIIQNLFRLHRNNLQEVAEDEVLIIIKNNMNVMKKILKEYEYDILSRII